MDHHSDIEIEEMREVAENFGRSRKRKGSSTLPYPLIGGVLIVVLIIIFVLFSGDGDKETSEDINTINSRLEQIEGKLSQLEKLEELEKKIKGVEKQITSSVKSIAQLKRKDTSLKKNINSTNTQISLLKDELSSVSGKTQTSGTVSKKRDYHVVKSGDSLFQIASKYDMEINELLALNKFTLKSTIHPGQKIIIRSN